MQDQLAATAAAHEQAVTEAALLREGADQQQVRAHRLPRTWCTAMCYGRVATEKSSQQWAPGVKNTAACFQPYF